MNERQECPSVRGGALRPFQRPGLGHPPALVAARRGGLVGHGFLRSIPTGGGLVTAVQDHPGVRFAAVALDQIRANPRQPREVFDPVALAELVASIQEVGVLQPIVIRPAGDGFELVMGERRCRAARLAGLSVIPAVVRDTEDGEMLRHALLENLQRAQLNPLEEAAGYRQVIDDAGCTHQELADYLGKSRAHVTATLSLLRLSVSVQRRVAAGVLSAGHARVLVSVGDPVAADKLATRIVSEGLSVRSTEEIVMTGNLPGAEEDDGRAHQMRLRRRRIVPDDLAEVQSRLTDRFDTRVRVVGGQARGRIVVEFGDRQDLQRILAMLEDRPQVE